MNRYRAHNLYGFAVPLLLAALVFLGGCNSQPEKEPSQPTADQEPAVYILSGQVVDVEEEQFLLRDQQQVLYYFPLPTEYDQNLEPGCQVRLSYNQELGRRKILSLQITPATLEDKAELILATMTTEEKVGQLFLARCPELDADIWADRLQLGGYILFDRDFKNKTPDQLREAIASYQQAVKIPMFIAVDEEGGQVVRASHYRAFRESAFPSAQGLYAQGGWEALAADAEEKCVFLQDLGINLNLAPVADVSLNKADFIYPRTIGLDGEQTAQYVELVVGIMVKRNIGSTLKHFPGYGDNSDTHTGAAYDQRPYETFLHQDFLPFRAGIEAGATMVMVSHNTVACMDPDSPASLSAKALGILRQELGFDGVAVTDDLAMDAAANWSGENSVAVQAFLAGNDMLCSSDFPTQYQQVLQAVQAGVISEERLNQSIRRIITAKLSLCLMDEKI